MEIAILLYVIGWIYFGGVMLILFIGYATGIESFQLPQFNIPIGLGIPLMIALFFSVILGAWIEWRFRTLAKAISRMTTEIKVDRKKVQQETTRVLAIEKKDVQMSVVKMAIEIESKLREIAISLGIKPNHKTLGQLLRELFKRGVLNERTINSIRLLWDIRNNIVHFAPGKLEEVYERAGLRVLD